MQTLSLQHSWLLGNSLEKGEQSSRIISMACQQLPEGDPLAPYTWSLSRFVKRSFGIIWELAFWSLIWWATKGRSTDLLQESNILLQAEDTCLVQLGSALLTLLWLFGLKVGWRKWPCLVSRKNKGLRGEFGWGQSLVFEFEHHMGILTAGIFHTNVPNSYDRKRKRTLPPH